MTRNLKIRPNFSNHKSIKIAAGVKRLFLQFEPSTHIFAGIGESFPNLEMLWIYHQEIKFINRQDFVGMTQIKSLALYSNKIEFLPENSFWDMQKLEYLWFNRNKIKKLPENIFKNLKKLKQVSFDDNMIEYLPKGLFADNLEMERIYAGGNPIKTIDIDFTKLTRLGLLALSQANCINFRAENKAQVQEALQIIKQNCTLTL